MSDEMTIEELERLREEFAAAPCVPYESRPTAPEGGWAPGDFPQLTIAPIPYTTDPLIRPDPSIRINEEGWMYIEAGGTRIAIPDREEWTKLVHMGEAMFNTHEERVAASQAQVEPHPCNYSDAGVLCGRTDTHNHEVNGITHTYHPGGAVVPVGDQSIQ